MKIKQVEELVGITRKNIRFYEEQGLLNVERAENGYREYHRADIARLQEIKLFRKMDISIEDMNELSMCFLGMGILMGIFGGMNETEIAEEFINGVKDIAFAAMVIGFCSGIMVIAQDGMIIDTILNALSGLVEKSNNVVFSAVMYVVQSLLTLLVPSSSGLAALSMPIMAPLCDLHGVNPEAAVTALQYGNQLTNLMSPVAGTTVAGLAICKISFGQWWKTIWKMFLIMAVIAIVFCTISAGL